jgi:PAS domain-containing protein
MSGWQRVPPGLDLPFTVTSRYGVALWVEDEDEGLRRFPQVDMLPGGPAPAFCTLPLHTDRFGIGVLGLTWDRAQVIGDNERAYLLGVAERVARRLDDLTAEDPALSTRAVHGAAERPVPAGIASPLLLGLDTMFNPATLLTPIRAGGEVVDFRFDYCNPATVDISGRPGTELVGRTLLELYPDWAGNGWFDAYVATLLSGRTAQFDGVRIPVGTDGSAEDLTLDIRVARLWDGLMLTWRRALAPDRALLDVMIRAEEATGSGSFSYTVSSGQLIVSPGAYRLLGWLGAPGSLDVEHLDELVAPGHRATAREAAGVAMTGQPITVELSLATGRLVTVTGRPVRTSTGRLLRIDGKIRTAVTTGRPGPGPARRPNRD